MELNRQNQELVLGHRPTLNVHSIWKTIQGEGPFAGSPAIFVRLAGCNLQCPMCDTDYTSGRKEMTPDEILDEIVKYDDPQSPPPLVVITGGEPFRQYLHRLLTLIGQADFGRPIQIETNGVLPHRLIAGDPTYWKQLTIVCSPKTVKIHRDNDPLIKHYKYIIESGKIDPTDGLPTSSLGYNMRVFRPKFIHAKTIWVQPLDVQDPDENKRHLEAAVASSLKFGYRLCLQMHKIAGLP